MWQRIMKSEVELLSTQSEKVILADRVSLTHAKLNDDGPPPPISIKKSQSSTTISATTVTPTTTPVPVAPATITTSTAGGESKEDETPDEKVDENKEIKETFTRPLQYQHPGDSMLCLPVLKLPENLEGLMRADHFPSQRHRWNTNEEIAAILISFNRHPEWLSKEVKTRPKSGSMFLYYRKRNGGAGSSRYRRDGYCWKKRKDGKTVREDHMKLKVQGTECIYGSYVHSALLKSFHRRCYWLLPNPEIILVHYLNAPCPDDNKLIIPNVSMWCEKKEWTKDELVSQLKPMFFNEEEPDLNNELELSTAETVESIVQQLMEKQRVARQSVLVDMTSGPMTLTVNTVNTVGDNGRGNCIPAMLDSSSNSLPTPSSTPSPGAPQNLSEQSLQLGTLVGRLNSSSSSSGSSTTSDPGQFQPVTNTLTVQIPSHVGGNGRQGGSGTVIEQQQQQRLTLHSLSSGQSGNGEQRPHPYLLNLTQFQSAGGLIILNGKPALATAVNKNAQQLLHQSTTLAAVQNNLNGGTVTSLMDIQNVNVSVERVREKCHLNSAIAVGSGGQNSSSSSLSKSTNSTVFLHHTTQHQFSSSSTSISNKPLQNGYASSSGSGSTENSQTHGSQQQQSGTSGNFYQQETLDMSNEDIQRTLQANMGQIVDTTVDLEPMSPSADEVFGNLDAFDILGDLADDLEHLPHGERNAIVDINPEWAYSEGGTKVLIVGQFYNANWDYTVHFGDFEVPAVYVQTGVLKCFCPPHNPGLVPIRVHSNRKQISANSMVFEYKVDLKPNIVQLPPSETSLKLCLISRIESLEKCFRNFKSDIFGSVKSLEDSIVRICYEMMSRDWIETEEEGDGLLPPPDRGMTLLHLTAALGFTRLIFTLLEWQHENPSCILKEEVNPHRVDDFGFIPLMWCARYGHLECGVILAQWNPSSLEKRTLEGHNSIQIAVSRGFTKFASELEKVEGRIRSSGSGGNGGGSSGKSGCSFGGLSQDLSSQDFVLSHLNRFHHRPTVTPNSEDFGLKDCFFGQPDASLELALPSEEESRVLTLAEQIIAAIESNQRNKKESTEAMSPSESHDSGSIMSNCDPSDHNDFGFELTDRNYRYYDSGTPCSSLSPSSSCLQSPCSSTFTVDSPQPTTADFSEFLQASGCEKDFSNLTLSDREQRELYEAAKVIQKAYRSYKGRKKMEEEEKEKVAAVIIQNYYRRYKEYAYLRQVTQAALVIQNQYRNYCENKRFKKSQESDKYRLVRENMSPFGSNPGIPRTNSQRRQHQAAKKIQQFMRQSKINWNPLRIIQTSERACRKREAGQHGLHCPAKMSSSTQQQRRKESHSSSVSVGNEKFSRSLVSSGDFYGGESNEDSSLLGRELGNLF